MSWYESRYAAHVQSAEAQEAANADGGPSHDCDVDMEDTNDVDASDGLGTTPGNFALSEDAAEESHLPQDAARRVTRNMAAAAQKCKWALSEI